MEYKKFSHFLAIIIMLIWGLSYLSIKVVVAEIDPTVSAFYRFLIASLILISILKIKYPKEKVLDGDKLKLALGGFFGVTLYFFFENYSVLFTSASNVAILISSIPVFTLLAQRVIYNEKLSKAKLFGATMSGIGIVIIVASKGKVSLFTTHTKGDLLALAAALCWVIYNIISTKFKGKYKSITVITYQSMWGCLFLVPSLFLVPLKVPSVKVTINIFFLAVFCSCIAYVMYNYCLQHLGATTITTYINLQAIVSLVAAAIILKESITIWQVLGSAIIIAGVFLVSIGEKFSKSSLKQSA